jgi:hypothetical protein
MTRVMRWFWRVCVWFWRLWRALMWMRIANKSCFNDYKISNID